MDRVQRAERRTVFFCVLALILLNLVVYGLWITKLGVYEDDWKLVVMPSTSLERLLANWWSFLRIERPLDGLNLAILSITLRVAGLLAVRVILLLPHLIACIVLFFLLQRMVGNQPWLSFLGAALFAVYPTDTSHATWLTGFNYSMAMLFTVIALWAFVKSTQAVGRNRIGLVGISLECYLISILLMEINTMIAPGFVVLWLAWIYFYQAPSERSLLQKVLSLARTSAPHLGVLTAYILWWTQLVPRYGDKIKNEMLDFSLGPMIWRLLRRLQVNFLFLEPIFVKARSVGWQEFMFPALLVFAGVLLVGLRTGRVGQGKLTPNPSRGQWVLYAGLGGLGMALVVMAYLPWIVLVDWIYIPTIFGLVSRANYGASLGSAIMGVGILGALAGLIDRYRPRLGLIAATILAAGLISFSTIFHYTNQKDFASSWQHQKRLYTGIQQQCPSLAPHTAVLIDGIGPVDWNKGNYVMTLWWLGNLGLRMLYSDPSLQANQTFGSELSPPEFRPDGLYLFAFVTGERFLWYPYERLIIFHYDLGTTQVSKVNTHWVVRPDGKLLSVKSNWKNCLTRPVADSAERRLALSLFGLTAE